MQWEQPDESPAAQVARVYANMRHAHEQCGRGPLTLYTCSPAYIRWTPQGEDERDDTEIFGRPCPDGIDDCEDPA